MKTSSPQSFVKILLKSENYKIGWYIIIVFLKDSDRFLVSSNNLPRIPKLVKPMKKLKLKITFLLLLGMFLNACGGGGGGGGSDSDSSSTAADLSTPQGYFTARVS